MKIFRQPEKWESRPRLGWRTAFRLRWVGGRLGCKPNVFDLPEHVGSRPNLRLLPRNLRYYRFAGSLTTPPCTEGVSWLVLKSYDHIDQAQAEKFTRAVGSHNNRPVQPLNARVVIE